MGREIKPEYVSPRIGEVHRISLDGERAKKELGFVPKYSLEEGIIIVEKENEYREVSKYKELKERQLSGIGEGNR